MAIEPGEYVSRSCCSVRCPQRIRFEQAQTLVAHPLSTSATHKATAWRAADATAALDVLQTTVGRLCQTPRRRFTETPYKPESVSCAYANRGEFARPRA